MTNLERLDVASEKSRSQFAIKDSNQEFLFLFTNLNHKKQFPAAASSFKPRLLKDN